MIISNEELIKILRIAFDTSSPEGKGISYHDAIKLSNYKTLRPYLNSSDLLPIIKTNNSLIKDWILFSEDKRTNGGFYLTDDYEINRCDNYEFIAKFNSIEEAIAEYIILELDAWTEQQE